jgi:hypothetical protein
MSESGVPNIQTANTMNAVVKEKSYFRGDVLMLIYYFANFPEF